MERGGGYKVVLALRMGLRIWDGRLRQATMKVHAVFRHRILGFPFISLPYVPWHTNEPLPRSGVPKYSRTKALCHFSLILLAVSLAFSG